MRLISLKIKNIASLKGEHEIHFADIQAQSPLFAITGETGAGKSSILNCIGLALYGKVYKSNVTQNDLVTLGEKEGQIELTFQSKGKHYLAFWKARVRKQNGELYSTPQTPQRELYLIEENQKTILNQRAEELLNLDFDQFCKCIILNQGEFARFLSSSFSERKEILEKLYPGEMLESLSRELKIELDTLQKQKSDLEIELSALKGDGPDGVDLEAEKIKLEASYKLHESWFVYLEEVNQHFSSLESYHKKHLENTTRIDALKATMVTETAIFNEHMVATRSAHEAFLTAQKQLEDESPRLLELLRAEEGLRLLNDQKTQTIAQLEKAKAQAAILSKKTIENQQKQSFWQGQYTDLVKTMQLPLEELRPHQVIFDDFFALGAKKENLLSDIQTRQERLGQLESQGKEEAAELKTVQEQLQPLDELKNQVAKIQTQLNHLKMETEARNRAEIRAEELQKQISAGEKLDQEIAESEIKAKTELARLQQELIPVTTSIKLQSLLSAVEVCLTHPSLEQEEKCPVCKTHLQQEQIAALKKDIGQTDFQKLRQREMELTRSVIMLESEVQTHQQKRQTWKKEHELKQTELLPLKALLAAEVPPLTPLEAQLETHQKALWDQEKIKADEQRLGLALKKSRELYAAAKSELATKKQSLDEVEKIFAPQLAAMNFMQGERALSLTQLQTEVRTFKKCLELETERDRLEQEATHLKEQSSDSEGTLNHLNGELASLESKIVQLLGQLERELQGKKASELLSLLRQEVKNRTDELTKNEKLQKDQELKLKDVQSRQYTLIELLKDIDLQFTRELHTLRELGKTQLELVGDALKPLIMNLAQLSLEIAGPDTLYVPLRDLIETQKNTFKEKTSELKMSFASVRTRLEEWERRQDRISLLHLKAQDLKTLLDRRARLYEVLGKDELRTFVLSLVEENLIIQTNEELQKLCQGRYEIVHQSRKMKLTPEFYILDKFREGGLRKVSTLSGGETFMVSLAMALGLAEMTRGKADIDSLFIDEGFGTLDEDSLEDVLDMLKQIQTRGLMVGLISHVKALTSALPVNLQVTKRQDGTSSVGIRLN